MRISIQFFFTIVSTWFTFLFSVFFLFNNYSRSFLFSEKVIFKNYLPAIFSHITPPLEKKVKKNQHFLCWLELAKVNALRCALGQPMGHQPSVFKQHQCFNLCSAYFYICVYFVFVNYQQRNIFLWHQCCLFAYF